MLYATSLFITSQELSLKNYRSESLYPHPSRKLTEQVFIIIPSISGTFSNFQQDTNMNRPFPRTCITPDGFRYAIHKPSYLVSNFRNNTSVQPLGKFDDDSQHLNSENFPPDQVSVDTADIIYEIANPFFFRGATYITKSWAESRVTDPGTIALPPRSPSSLCKTLQALGHQVNTLEGRTQCLAQFPEPVLLAMAANSTDPDDLTALAQLSCQFVYDGNENPIGLRYQKDKHGSKPVITNHALFEIVVNNQTLPDTYKEIMVLRPGAQGNSEIVGEWQRQGSHVFEYLRRNSYIPWGHYAANMANDSIRYHARDLNLPDMNGLRHLYYQRTFSRFAELLGIALPETKRTLSEDELEDLRVRIIETLNADRSQTLQFSGTLWGWNYGFDCAASKYRLHASHQMIHQQFALLPTSASQHHLDNPSAACPWQTYVPYGCGDLIKECLDHYDTATGRDLFSDYESAIRHNKRMDGRDNLPASLIIYEDAGVMLFVPKAQTSQWELQLMVTTAGNILEADKATRKAINKAMLIAIKTLAALGAEMVSTIEYPKRLSEDSGQRLLYSFLPKLPFAPGAFSEAQLRWIVGHYPEDFARACREKAEQLDILRDNSPENR